jgi:hypothetical protein
MPIGELERAVVDAMTCAHSAQLGGAPLGACVLLDGDDVLLIARSDRWPTAAEALRTLQTAVREGVYLRSDEMLRPAGASTHPRRGLLVLAFEREALTARRAQPAGDRAA